jgi:hypothetical protein
LIWSTAAKAAPRFIRESRSDDIAAAFCFSRGVAFHAALAAQPYWIASLRDIVRRLQAPAGRCAVDQKRAAASSYSQGSLPKTVPRDYLDDYSREL